VYIKIRLTLMTQTGAVLLGCCHLKIEYTAYNKMFMNFYLYKHKTCWIEYNYVQKLDSHADITGTD